MVCNLLHSEYDDEKKINLQLVNLAGKGYDALDVLVLPVYDLFVICESVR